MSRVTDAELADLLTWNQKNGDAYMTAYEARQLLIELKERRALDEHRRKADEELIARRQADLSDEDREALTFAAGVLSTEAHRRKGAVPHGWQNRAHAALSVLDRLLSHAGGDK